MVNDEKRREVAENLRKQLKYMKRDDDYMKDVNVVVYGNLTYRNIAASVELYGNFIKGNYAHIVELLVDLIERPTCTIRRIELDAKPTAWGICSRCGAFVNVMHGISSMTEYLPSKYCPNCGAGINKVVRYGD